MELALFMDKSLRNSSLSMRPALLWTNLLGCLLGFRRSLIQRWLIRKEIPRIQASYYADFSLFYNVSIFFKLLCSLRLLISRDVGVFV